VFYYLFHPVFKNCVGFQALIQYQSRQSAVTARSTLQVVLLLHGACGILLGLLISGKTFLYLIILLLTISRDAIFMMVVVSWTFSSQSRLNLSQHFLSIVIFGFRDLCYASMLLINPVSPIFLPLPLLIFGWIIIHVHCSLDELQVNYNNDRSRCDSIGSLFLVFLNIVSFITLIYWVYSSCSTGTSQTQICLLNRKVDLHKYVLCY